MKNSTINQSPRNQGCQYALASRMSDLDWESELGLVMWVGLSWMSCAKLWWVEWVVWVLFSSLGLVSLWWTQFRRDYHLKRKDKNATDEEHHALHCLKGKLGDFFYQPKVFIGPKLREVSKSNFYRKAPKLVKNQVKGSKIDQIRTKRPTATVGIHSIQVNSYCRNPPI